MVTAKSRLRVTDVLSVLESSAGFVTVSLTAVRVAVLLMVFVPVAVEAAAVSTTVRVSEAPLARSPTVHAVPEKLVPPLGVLESKVTPKGRVKASLTTTPVASDGPLFVTVIT